MSLLADRRRGMSFVEVLIAASISSMIFIILATAMIWVAKGMLVVQTQASRQYEASQALDSVTGILRNAEFDTIEINSDGNEVRFQDGREGNGVVSRIWTENVTVDGDELAYRLLYRPDSDDEDSTEELGALLAKVTFEQNDNGEIGDDDEGAMINIYIEFTYQSFRDRPSDESRNALFHTTVFMRNI